MAQSIFLFYCYNVHFCIGLYLSYIMHVFCIVLSIISILYFSIYIHVIFSYSAFLARDVIYLHVVQW